ncbi:sensor histidine kinase [Lysobacter solisilvae (ex Woo and Kim 2020)]|uniref:Sensor histidine kinase n=1 Tax=Agrilutibacter terrestris TaxID=2865112 RepID=A0A7H0FVM2_9GAMM|nr:sensor histidine kinase [Lysobacter terrestris]QNP40088.1 sensor histidine kinase [Lysobacter terrestris]
MLARLNHSQLLRYAGLFTWAAVGLWLLNVWLDPTFVPPEPDEVLSLRIVRWLAVYLAFGVVFWWITRALGQRRPGSADHALLLVLTACAIGVSYFSGTGLGSILLMVLAGLLPWLLRLPVGVAWLIGSNLATVPVFVNALDFPPMIGVLQSLLYLGFSSFVFVTALVARQQAEAREEQRRLNAELRATRALLGESVRVNERTRISRELHDLLGHHLTALSLNLEVAGHLAPEGRAREHVQQAHTLAKLLLTDVREAVSQLREGGAIDLASALRPLSENVPALDIHMDIEAPLTLDDPERAHVLLRCTQEIITNTVRHANAHNLWIHVRREGCNIVVDARDDGRGADALVAGNGLRGMRERLAQYGGDLRIDTHPRPHPEAGFRLRLTLPASATLAASEGAIA